MSYFLYILKSKTADKHYIGSSENPQRRLQYHNSIEKGFTPRYRPWEIVYTKEYETKEIALTMERKVKGWKSKEMIEKLINGNVKL